MNNQTNKPTPMQLALQKYAGARANLLFMIILSAVDILLIALQIPFYFPFSSSFSYFSVTQGLGMYLQTGAIGYLLVGAAIAVVILLPFLLSWVFSKKHVGWMIAALALFSLDTVFLIVTMILFPTFSSIVDILLHAWVLYELILGVVFGLRLKKEQ